MALGADILALEQLCVSSGPMSLSSAVYSRAASVLEDYPGSELKENARTANLWVSVPEKISM